jgi:phosphatidylserine decarboxylase
VARANYTQQLLDRAQAYVEQPLTARRYADGMAEVTALYAEITGEPVSNCRQCQYSNYLAVVTAYIREATRSLHPETMADSKYTFAPAFANEQIADGRYNKVVTAETLTDKDAEKLIELGYGHVIVKKGAAEANAAAGEDKTDTSAAEKKAKDEATTAKAELKTEKAAHGETKKELAKVQKQLGDVQKQLEKAQSTATTPASTMTASSTTPAPAATAVPEAPADGTQA